MDLPQDHPSLGREMKPLPRRGQVAHADTASLTITVKSTTRDLAAPVSIHTNHETETDAHSTTSHPFDGSESYNPLRTEIIISALETLLIHGRQYGGFDVDTIVSWCSRGPPQIPPWRMMYGYHDNDSDTTSPLRQKSTHQPYEPNEAAKDIGGNTKSSHASYNKLGYEDMFNLQNSPRAEDSLLSDRSLSGPSTSTGSATSSTRWTNSDGAAPNQDGTEKLVQTLGSGKREDSFPVGIITVNIPEGHPEEEEIEHEDKNSSEGAKAWIDEKDENDKPIEHEEADVASAANSLELLDPRLRQYSSILPPHIFNGAGARRTTKNIGSVEGKALSFTWLANIEIKKEVDSEDAIQTSLEFVEGERRRLFVIKKHNPLTMDPEGRTQMETERAVYARIAGVSGEEPGTQFLMWLDAAVTFADKTGVSERGLVMPAMSTTLGGLLDNMYGMSTCMSRNETRRIMAQCVIGIATLHSIGVIHADIKPDNIFLDARRNVRIGDFGLSCLAKKERPLKATVAYGRRFGGTDGYIAPERVAEPSRFGYQADYWALGLIFWEMVVGHYRFLEALKGDGVEKWAYYHKEVDERRGYFKRDFSEEWFDLELELQLVCELVDPCPQTRMGIDQLLVHRYFEVDGVSEFKDIREKALNREEDNTSPCQKTGGATVVYKSEKSDANNPWRWIKPSENL